MTEVTFSQDGFDFALECAGHTGGLTGKDQSGRNAVCAAVSLIVLALFSSLDDRYTAATRASAYAEDIRYAVSSECADVLIEPGYARINVTATESDLCEVAALYKLAVNALLCAEHEWPREIEVSCG